MAPRRPPGKIRPMEPEIRPMKPAIRTPDAPAEHRASPPVPEGQQSIPASTKNAELRGRIAELLHQRQALRRELRVLVDAVRDRNVTLIQMQLISAEEILNEDDHGH